MTTKEVEEKINELRIALLEKIEADKNETKAILKKQKARFRLQKAKEGIRNIEKDSHHIVEFNKTKE